MDFIIMFFRDILDGPLYIIVAIISGILICSCIGYMAEVSLNKKKANTINPNKSEKIPNKKEATKFLTTFKSLNLEIISPVVRFLK